MYSAAPPTEAVADEHAAGSALNQPDPSEFELRALDHETAANLKKVVDEVKASGVTQDHFRAAFAELGVDPETYRAALRCEPISAKACHALIAISFDKALLEPRLAKHGWRPVDHAAIGAFVSALFRHASTGVLISLRTFVEGQKPRLQPHRFESVAALAAAAGELAQAAADDAVPTVFCPPIVGLAPPDGEEHRAREQDVIEAYALSTECDEAPAAARRILEDLLGLATVVVASGGEWMDAATGEVQAKLHLHWRLKEPATGDDLLRLKEARRLAARLVGADVSNVPVVHPIRWPGSWHRKGAPRRAEIIALRPEVELELSDALERLEEATTSLVAGSGGAEPPIQAADLLAELTSNVLAGKDLHNSILRLAAKLVGCGMYAGAAVTQLRSLMLQTPPDERDYRWQARFDDIPRAVATAADKFGASPDPGDEAEIVDDPCGRGDPPAAAGAADPEELPDRLTRVPGMVGEIVDWIEATGRHPQRALALGAALAIVGTAAGRVYAGPTNSGTHLYILGLAPTGAGKNHAPKMGQRLMEGAGMGAHIGPAQYMSLGAVFRDLAEEPKKLAFIDEFGAYLARITAVKGSAHERAVKDILRMAWGCSFEILRPLSYADASRKLANIEAPALSIYGMSTPEEFYRALSGEDVFNGFLNRFLVFSTFVKPAEIAPAISEFELPTSLVTRLQAVLTPKRGTFARAFCPWAPAVRVPWGSDAANQAYDELKQEIGSREEDEALLSRVAEMTVRLATIRAVGCDPDAPAVSLADVEWAKEIVLWSANRLIAQAREFMADTENQRVTKQIKRVIKEAGGRVSHSALLRKLQHTLPSKRVTEVVQALKESEELDFRTVKTSGRDAREYVLRRP